MIHFSSLLLESKLNNYLIKIFLFFITFPIIASRSSSANRAGTIPVVNILLINSKNPISNEFNKIIQKPKPKKILINLLQQHVDHQT